MLNHMKYACALAAVLICAAAGGQEKDAKGPTSYVPYSDIAAAVDPAGKAVLMDRVGAPLAPDRPFPHWS